VGADAYLQFASAGPLYDGPVYWDTGIAGPSSRSTGRSTCTCTWRTGSVGFEEAAVVSTPDSLWFGFGFEGISDAGVRNAVLGRAMGYLLH